MEGWGAKAPAVHGVLPVQALCSLRSAHQFMSMATSWYAVEQVLQRLLMPHQMVASPHAFAPGLLWTSRTALSTSAVMLVVAAQWTASSMPESAVLLASVMGRWVLLANLSDWFNPVPERISTLRANTGMLPPVLTGGRLSIGG